MKFYVIVLFLAALIADQYVSAVVDTDKNQGQDNDQQSDSDNNSDANSDAKDTSNQQTNQQSNTDTKSSPNQPPTNPPPATQMPDEKESIKTVSDLIVTSDRKKCGCCPPPCCCKCARRTVVKETKVEGTTEPPMTTTPFIPECNNTLDVLFIMDASGSITPSNWVIAKEFVLKVISKFTIGKKDTRVAVITYSTNVVTHWDFKDPRSYSNNIADLIKNLPQERRLTNTVGALFAGTKVFESSDRQVAPNVAIVMTDGRPNFDTSQSKVAADGLKDKAGVISIGVSKAVVESQLQEMATGGNVFMVDQFDDLSKILQALVQTVCEEIPSRPPPTTPEPQVIVTKTIEEQCTCCCPQPHLYIYGGQGSSEGTCS